MKREAARRLEALTEQMDELKREQKGDATTTTQPTALSVTPATSSNDDENEIATKSIDHSLDSMEGDWADPAVFQPSQTDNIILSSSSSAAASPSPQIAISLPTNTNLLVNTRWKVAFNIGRESGTWMPNDWGNSGDRLLFHVVIDFTDDILKEREDFFHGSTAAGAKVLNVKEAWVVPVGVGTESRGRQPVRVKSTGGYKVLPGQGPLGTDIVRFYVELEEDVKDKLHSDVFCPRGRVYATCGYFPIHRKDVGIRSARDIMEDEHRDVMIRYEQLSRQIDTEESLFSMERLKLMKELFDVKRELERSTRRLREARQREPERSQLRLTRDGGVGLTKEGGVCCKVRKGVTLEYHILGRIELACIEKHEDHDEYQELVHQLHP
jgi:hypothetical protein